MPLSFRSQASRYRIATRMLRRRPASVRVPWGGSTIAAAEAVTSSRILTDVLKRSDWFDVEQFPAMRYAATEVSFDGDVPVAANGQLTLRGVTKPVTLAIADFRCGTHLVYRRAMCSAEATATIRRSEFGMTSGLPNVAGDDVRIVIPVEATIE